MTATNRSELERIVASHYAKPGLDEAIVKGLEQAGADPGSPTIEDLAPVDEFHTAGRLSTLKALDLMPLERGMHVLDAGCGIGGAVRCLAREHDCRATGIDLTAEYVEVARMLTARMGLSEHCSFYHGSVLEMPFAPSSFDAGVSFHVAMNIEDRPGFYGELARVLRPDAPLCIFDVMKGPSPGLTYPVPWAETESISFLRTRDETCCLLEDAGFEVRAEENLRPFAQDFFRKVFAKLAEDGGPPPLGLHLLAGANAPEKFVNYSNALEAHQIEPVIIVAVLR